MEAADVIDKAGGYDCGWPDRGDIRKSSLRKPGPDDYVTLTGRVPPIDMLYPSHDPRYGLLDKSKTPFDDRKVKDKIRKRLERDAMTGALKDVHEFADMQAQAD